MLPTPPTSTLFPYTTLFRSRYHVQCASQIRVPGDCLCHPLASGSFGCEARGFGRKGDRKSTRLNSSHTVISYAVFCLKKKIKKEKSANHSNSSANAINA